MNLSDIHWDLDHAGSWPRPVQIAVAILLSLAVAGVWYYLDTGAQLDQLSAEQSSEMDLRANFERKQTKAANLAEYKDQLREIERTFGSLLKQLPNKTQVPELLVEVSQTGLASGLEFELFKPGAEVIQEFYAELPIEVRVLGTYVDFGVFVSGLASLPRIVTVHDIKITPHRAAAPVGQKTEKLPLTMSALVRTYRYLEEDETPQKIPPGGAMKH
jgi:type IV pilus assembly protein PilO